MGLLKSWFQYSMIDALLPLMSKQKPFNTATTKDCRESYRMKILEYKWETVRKRFLNDCLWKASDGGKEMCIRDRFLSRKLCEYGQCAASQGQGFECKMR